MEAFLCKQIHSTEIFLRLSVLKEGSTKVDQGYVNKSSNSFSSAIAFFSIFIFDSALSGWFNKKISTAISQSVEVANQYLNEHQSAIRGEILELVNLINTNSNFLFSDKNKFNNFLNKYSR